MAISSAVVLKEKLSQTEEYQRFKRIYTALKKSIDIEALRSEALGLFGARLSRGLKSEVPSARKIIDSSMQDMSFRSRLVEIRVGIAVSKGALDEAIDAIRRFTLAKYTVVGRTKMERSAMLNAILTRPITHSSEMEKAIEMFDHLIKDFDQTNYHMKTVVKCLELMLDNKAKSV